MTQHNFIGRVEELKKLESLYHKKENQLVVVYGRRRVGKSTLLERFCQDKPNIYFVGRKNEHANDLSQRYLWYIAEYFKNPILSKLAVNDWKEIFDIIDIELSKTKQKIIIILDEFQWMCESKKSTLLSALQAQWDTHWKNGNKIFLVLCGSIVSFMEKNVLSQKSPLYGRRTCSFELNPMTAEESKLRGGKPPRFKTT